MTCLRLYVALLLVFPFPSDSSNCEKNSDCINGVCKANICICNDYWWGDLCQFCRERRTEGEENKMMIVEGKQNSLPYKCTWLIKAKDDVENSSVSLKVNEFTGLCGNRSLYIYDGSSVQSPLISVVSLITTSSMTLVPLTAESGSAFVVLTGTDKSEAHLACHFNITYRFEQHCSKQCSNHGYCNKENLHCVCDRGWTGINCSSPICPVPCLNGSCDITTRQCSCSPGFSGESCDVSDGQGSWSSPVVTNQDLLDAVASHALSVHGNDIWLFGGLSLANGPVKTLARYSILENRWELITASSTALHDLKPSERYGHSLVTYRNTLVLFGGVPVSQDGFDLWTFNVTARQWSPHRSNRYVSVTGHSATMVGNVMVVLFGYDLKEGFSRNIQRFDLETLKWKGMQQAPPDIIPSYGHSGVYDPDTELIYLHGGYRPTYKDGELCTETTGDIITYDPEMNQWQRPLPLPMSGVRRFLHSAVLVGRRMLVYGGRGSGQSQASSSLFTVYNLINGQWRTLRSADVPETSFRYGHSSVLVNRTMYVFGGFGGKMYNSFLQYYLDDCLLSHPSTPCGKAISRTNIAQDICVSNSSRLSSCHHQQNCSQCLEHEPECVWCESNKQCLPKAAYNVIFPYLQCLQVLEHGLATCTSSQCGGMKSCQECHTLPGCGWCDDISATGLGKCMDGGNDAPFHDTCANSRWYFVDCPACQCHGHSKCSKENICGECKDHTTGSNCQQCAAGYFGDPRNGGKCHACRCSAHADSCAADTGKCTCLTVGVVGHRCNECNHSDRYYGNVSKDGFCYYNLLASSSFNLTGKRLFSFAYYPLQDKRNVKVGLRWRDRALGASAYVNITSFYARKPDEKEKMLDEKRSVGEFENVYRYHDFDFANENKFGFRGYVYGVSCGKSCFLEVKITQPADNIDLLEFFLTFFGCFLSLLVVAGIVWKVRNRYISFLLSRQRREERHKMASRPFAKVSILFQSPCKCTPSPVSMEPCLNNKASVLTVLMRLPGDESGFAPVGQSGTCFASVLATSGDSTRNNPTGKATKIKTRKRCSATGV